MAAANKKPMKMTSAQMAQMHKAEAASEMRRTGKKSTAAHERGETPTGARKKSTKK
jgi:hypothetical protein